jgi:hypothetical protein
MTRLLSIDPGLDGIGVALFDAEKYSPTPDLPGPVAAVRAWEASWTITTDPADELADRCAAIALQLQADVQRWTPRLVYLEVPEISGDYGDNRGRRRSVNLLHVGIGAVLAGLGAATAGRLIDVHQVKPGTAAKESRQAWLEEAFRKARIRLPVGPRGGKKEDEVDAIWLGWWCLQHRVSGDLRRVA